MCVAVLTERKISTIGKTAVAGSDARAVDAASGEDDTVRAGRAAGVERVAGKDRELRAQVLET